MNDDLSNNPDTEQSSTNDATSINPQVETTNSSIPGNTLDQEKPIARQPRFKGSHRNGNSPKLKWL